MLKNRLYYQDAYHTKFTTHIIKHDQAETGDWYVVLENTAFYPTGGGQPHDTGRINGIEVIQVEEVDDEIRHTLAKKLNSADVVECVVNWERRFDHMQQHAGQHMLTAGFAELFNFQTISFHLGEKICSIDLDTPEVSIEQLEASEKRVNEIILANLPIETKWVTEEELSDYPLRKNVTETDEIRLVIIPNIDYNGCGGTHPSSTGQVQAIKIIATEKQKRKTRVHFICGGRILQQFHNKNLIITEASRQLSASEEGINKAINHILTTNRSLEKSLEETQESLLLYEANDLLRNKEQNIVKASFIGRTIKEIQKLARLVVHDEKVIALFVTENDNGLQFVAARGMAENMSMKQVSQAALTAIQGKGGGSDTFVQGGGEKAISSDELLNIMHNSIQS